MVAELDLGGQDGFLNFLDKLPDESTGKIRLFERNNGEYYTVHGSDALFVANHVYQTKTVLKNLGTGERSYPSCSVKKLAAVSLIRDLLLVLQYRVEIWCCENKKWSLMKSASPGNLIQVEDLIFNNDVVSTSPVVLSVKLGNRNDQKVIGIAYTDATINQTIGIAEFIDNESFSNFEALLVQLGVRECLVDGSAIVGFEGKKMREILDRAKVVVTEMKKVDFQIKNIEQDLGRLLGDEVNVASLPQFDMKLGLTCVASLIKYLGVLSDSSCFGKYTLTTYDLSQYMKLDATALKALNVIPASTTENKNMSLIGLLNKCKTSQGTRLLSQWIKQPLKSIAMINRRLNTVQAFVEESELRQTLEETELKSFPDFNRLGKKFSKKSASLQDVVCVYQVVCRLPRLKGVLESYDGEFKEIFEEDYITKLGISIEKLENFRKLVELTIDLDSIDTHDILIKSDFDASLTETKETMDTLLKNIQSEARNIAESLNMDLEKKLKFDKSSTYGYHLRLTRTEASKIRGKKEYIELCTQKSGVLFTTFKMKQLNEEYDSKTERYQSKQKELEREIIDTTASYFVALEDLNELIAQLDVLISLAHASIHAPFPYIRPTFSDSVNISLKGSRHPCLEQLSETTFIPNDVDMAKNTSSFQIITGPNMGGKSTYIRTVGVVSLMAQIGCFVPCEEAKLRVFDKILARVGAGDSQLKGVSTFMSEMLETASILKSATKDSLIIIDELGRGTSTHDGFGLAWAIAEFISKNLHSFTLFATHFHELTDLANQVPCVVNRHVIVHTSDKEITLLYKVEDGVCEQSFGIFVAEMADFPKNVVRLAKRKVQELEDDSGRAWKCSKIEQEQGNEKIESFLSRAKEMIDVGDSEGVRKLIQSKKEEGMFEDVFVKEVLEMLG